MKRAIFPKRILSVILCLAFAVPCFAFSDLSAHAAGDEPPRSAWEMTVPQIRVTTAEGNGTTLQKEDDYQDASIIITDTDGSVLSDDCLFKVRGNTTALSWVTKKPFTFKFAKKKNVLGLGSGKKWALIANAFDPTLLRNITAFEIAKELELAYTSEYKVVELWVDDSFRGCYTLFEPVQEGKDRVDIDIESNDGKKDFLIEYEKNRVEDDVTYFTVGNLRFIASEPEEPTEEQLAYIHDTMEIIYFTIRGGNRERIESLIDVESFAKFFLLNEYMKTFDFDMSSVFYYYKDGKLYGGPAWDYDLSSGNSYSEYGARGKATVDPEGMHANKNLMQQLASQEWFIDEVRKIYRRHYAFFADIGADGGFLDTQLAAYSDVFARNYSEAGWKVNKWWINISRQPDKTYAANFDYLKEWCMARNDWMRSYYLPYEGLYVPGDANGNGTVEINDATTVQRHIAELELLDEPRLSAADVDRDGSVTVEDVTILQRWLAEFEVEYEIG